MSEPILLEVQDAIALITLNRPERLNALNYALIDHLMAALDAIEVDSSVRAVILTGAGERAFSAGADVHEFSESVRHGPATAVRDFVRRGQAMTARLEAFKKPVIAAVNGLAFGGGCEITEAVHLAIASERAKFAKPEINLGMPPTFGGTQRACRGWLAASARWNCCSPAIPSRRSTRWRSGWSTRWCHTTNCCRLRAALHSGSSGIRHSH